MRWGFFPPSVTNMSCVLAGQTTSALLYREGTIDIQFKYTQKQVPDLLHSVCSVKSSVQLSCTTLAHMMESPLWMFIQLSTLVEKKANHRRVTEERVRIVAATRRCNVRTDNRDPH